MKPYRIEWSPAKLAQVRAAVAGFDIPPLPRQGGWEDGCDPDFLARLRSYWLDGFDVTAAAATLNRYPQFRADVGDHSVHFVHVVGEAQGRRPLLLTHGWPGSIFEFWKVIDALAFPSSVGGTAADAYDLVIPSLPGYGFSSKPSPPIGARTTAAVFDTLMREMLGYRTYRAQGGDWGAAVTAWLALDRPASLDGIHLNMLLTQPAATPKTAAELAWQARRDAAQSKLGAYALLQGTKPGSLAYAMAANPMAQAAWLVERFHDWSDRRERPFEEIFPLDDLLTDIMIYVMNDAFVPSIFFYAAGLAENVRAMPQGRRVHVPTAFAAYPDPRSPPPPREWVERGYDIVRWTDQPRGGHFPAMEVPALFVDDLRAWGRST